MYSAGASGFAAADAVASPNTPRRGDGAAKPWAPPNAYAENAFTRAGEWWRAGDLLRLPNSAGVGDLAGMDGEDAAELLSELGAGAGEGWGAGCDGAG